MGGEVSRYKKITFLSPTTGPARFCPGSGNRRGYGRRADETSPVLQLLTLALPQHWIRDARGDAPTQSFYFSIRLKDTRFNQRVRPQRVQRLRRACKGGLRIATAESLSCRKSALRGAEAAKHCSALSTQCRRVVPHLQWGRRVSVVVFLPTEHQH